ncbi:serine protease, partial [Chytridiales sp. JEL 0842]
MPSSIVLNQRVKRYVSRRVWELASDSSAWEKVETRLSSGLPFVLEEFSAVAMIDISGYSSLTSQLSTLGKVASEIITTSVKQFLAKSSVVNNIRRASTITSPYSTNASSNVERITLGVHAALTAGTISKVILGSGPSDRMDYSISGNCLSSLGELLDGTTLGELGVDTYTMSLLPDWFLDKVLPASRQEERYWAMTFDSSIIIGSIISQLKTQQPFITTLPGELLSHEEDRSPEMDTQNSAALQIASKFVNPSLIYQIFANQTAHGENEFRGEFRTVTVVFAKIPKGTTLERVNDIFVEFLSSISTWKGTVQQYSVDDKGQTLFACFGLPPLTFEKDALHACKAVVEFNKNIEKRGLGKIPVAIATGQLLYSELGNQWRGDASLLGDVVNLAARLLAIASSEGTLVCDKPTYDIVVNDFKLGFLGNFKVKGKEEEIPVYGAKNPPEGTNVRANVKPVGYDREIQRNAKDDKKLEEDSQARKAILKRIVVKLFGLVTDRPIADIKTEHVRSITELPRVVHLKLQGLNRPAIETIILRKFTNQGAKEVDQSVVSAIFEKSQGHPLRADMLIGALQAHDEDKLVEVTKEGLVRAQQWQTFIDRVSQIQQTGAEIVQFDRLDHEFKDLLRRASIFGQYFDILEIEEAIGLGSLTAESVLTKLETMDKYKNFLKCYFDEAVDSLEKLIDIGNEMADQILSGDMHVVMHPTRVADWRAHLGYVFVSQRKQQNRVTQLCTSALEKVGVKFPQTLKEVKNALINSAFSLFKLWRATRGGTKVYTVKGIKQRYLAAGSIGHNLGDGCSFDCVECPKRERVRALCFKSVFMLGLTSAAITPELLAYTIFKACCSDIKTAAIDDGEFVMSCYRIAYGMYTKLPWLSNIFRKRGAMMERSRDLASKVDSFYHLLASLDYARGLPSMAYENIDRGINRFALRADASGVFAAKGLKAQFGLWVGKLDEAKEIAKPYMNLESMKVNQTWTIFITFFVCRPLMYEGDTVELEKHQKLLEQFVGTVTNEEANKGYSVMVLLIKAWLSFQQGDLQKSLNEFCQFTESYQLVSGFGPVAMESLINSAILALLLLPNCKSAPIFARRVSDELIDASKIKKSCMYLLARSKQYVKKVRWLLASWSVVLFESVLLMIDGQHMKATKMIQSECRTHRQELSAYPLLRGVLLAAVANVSNMLGWATFVGVATCNVSFYTPFPNICLYPTKQPSHPPTMTDSADELGKDSNLYQGGDDSMQINHYPQFDAGEQLASLYSKNSTSSEKWEETLKRIIPAIVSIRFISVRNFDTEHQRSSQATGFVVDKERGIILTNRHVVTPGPILAEAIFNPSKEEIELKPIYRDPVHDFGFFQFDVSAVKYMKVVEISLKPEKARVGIEIRVVGNDKGERLSILSGTLARLDRQAPAYGSGKYNVYYQAASMTSGGSSGSPVINADGEAIALNAGGAVSAASSFFLPLDRILRALRFIQQGMTVPRGTLQTIFRHSPYDEVRRLGLKSDIESEVRQISADNTGMLVARQVLPKGPAEGKLESGDILVKVNGTYVIDFVSLATYLDDAVGNQVQFTIQRGGTLMDVELTVQNLHEITPDRFVEVGGDIVHSLSYQMARSYMVPVGSVYVGGSEYMLAMAGVGRKCIISHVNDIETPDLDSFIGAFQTLKDGDRVPVRFYAVSDINTEKVSLMNVDRRWHRFRLAIRNDSTGLWDYTDMPPCLGRATFTPHTATHMDLDVSLGPGRHILPGIVLIEFNMPFIIDGVLNTRHFGTGLIVDAKLGLILTDRNTIPTSIGDVTLIFASSIIIPGQILYIHQVYNFALLKYDVSLIGETYVKEAVVSSCELQQGDSVYQVCLSTAHIALVRKTVVTNVRQFHVADPSVPTYRATNVEGIELENPLGHSGVLVDDDGNVQALYPAYTKHSGNNKGPSIFHLGLSMSHITPVVQELSSSLTEGHPLPPRYTLEVNLSYTQVAQARLLGLKDEWVKKIEEMHLTRRNVLAIRKVTSEWLLTQFEGAASSDLLKEGDLLLAVNGSTVSNYYDIMSQTGASELELTILRRKEEINVKVPQSIMETCGTERLVGWAGAIFQMPHKGVFQTLKTVPPGILCAVVYNGSPAQLYNLHPTNFVTEINGVPVTTLDEFITIVSAIPSGTFARIKMVNFTRFVKVIALRTNNHYFPTWELRRGDPVEGDN